MSLLEAAVNYASRGHAVLPLKPRDKVPDGALVPHGLNQATSDLATVEGWWKASPNANIGVRTGVMFDALDVDADGWRTLAYLVDEHGSLPSGPVVMTNSGAHYWFKVTGQGNRAGFLPGLDWRGHGGYVLVPPSIHPSGTPYEWAIPPDEAELVGAPPWLVARLTRQLMPPAAPSRRADTSAYGRRALETECGRVALAPEGSRNHQLNRSAFALGGLILAGVLDAGEVADALYDVAIRAGLEHREVVATIRSGFSTAEARRVP